MLSISLEKHLRIGATGPMLCSHKKCILSGHGLVHSPFKPPQQSHQIDCKELLITYNCARANHCTLMTPSRMKMVIPHFEGSSFISNILANFFHQFHLILFVQSN